MTAATFSIRDPRLAGLRVLVVGLGRSGLASARLLASKNARVVATDTRGEADLGREVHELRKLQAEMHLGGNPPDLAREADLVVVSPGVPLTAPLIQVARASGVPVWGEVELAFRFCRGRIIGVTGSNGKSTVTSMVGAILREAGITGATGGNLGTPLADLLAFDGPDAVHAVELSSFQLESIDAFRPTVAVIVNLSPDHLDRYPSYDAYAGAKARLLEAQNLSGHAVLNADDAQSARFFDSVRGVLHCFSTRTEVADGSLVRKGWLVVKIEGAEEEILPVSELPVPGEHNRANALAAALACRIEGCPAPAIARGLRSFRALPHRLELVRALDGIAFYNDSKATNLDAAARALESFPPGTVHLILGGKDKGADWPSFAPLVRRHARRVLLVGQAAPAVEEALREVVPLARCGTVEVAVHAGFAAARPGETVLLSPGCASFDQYRNFEERGEDFRRVVQALASEGGRNA